MKFTHPAVGLSIVSPLARLCTNSVLPVRLSTPRNLIPRRLMGSYIIILSKSNYRVRLNVNMNIVDSISFYPE